MTPTSQPKQFAPVVTHIREVQSTLDKLWGKTQVEARSYTGNLVVLTTSKNLSRIQQALSALDARHAGRHIIGVIDGDDNLDVTVSLVQNAGGFYIERLILDANEKQLQGGILPLLRPATVNYVWWAAPSLPATDLLKELSDIADQVIANSLALDIRPSSQFALADLSWSRSAGWREALAQVFDSPDAAAQIPRLTDLRVKYAGDSDLAARLFAGFVGDRLGWRSLDKVEFDALELPRDNGDLCGVVLSGKDVEFSLQAQGSGEKVMLTAYWDGHQRQLAMVVPSMSLSEGLVRVMERPQRRPIFERSWKLALNSMLEPLDDAHLASTADSTNL